jgi:hypothetical protein
MPRRSPVRRGIAMPRRFALHSERLPAYVASHLRAPGGLGASAVRPGRGAGAYGATRLAESGDSGDACRRAGASVTRIAGAPLSQVAQRRPARHGEWSRAGRSGCSRPPGSRGTGCDPPLDAGRQLSATHDVSAGVGGDARAFGHRTKAQNAQRSPGSGERRLRPRTLALQPVRSSNPATQAPAGVLSRCASTRPLSSPSPASSAAATTDRR